MGRCLRPARCRRRRLPPSRCASQSLRFELRLIDRKQLLDGRCCRLANLAAAWGYGNRLWNDYNTSGLVAGVRGPSKRSARSPIVARFEHIYGMVCNALLHWHCSNALVVWAHKLHRGAFAASVLCRLVLHTPLLT